MSLQRLRCICFLFLFSSAFTFAQTTLYPGDIVLLSMATNLGGCGLPAQSDQFSFTCFQDIETGTVIDITDNGWETQYAGFWGDHEGVLSMVRTGGPIPFGTVITVQCQLVAGVWQYRTITPDNGWAIANINVPGGPFNLDDGGEQIYFMQGGTWNNNGGFSNRATYDGTLIFAANNHATWAADGSFNESNLHPDLIPCYYTQPSNGLMFIDFMEYGGPMGEADHFEWLQLTTSPQYWYSGYTTCQGFNNAAPDWSTIPSIPIEDNISLICALTCNVCPPFDKILTLYLPDGEFNVEITNGVDTFIVPAAENEDYVIVNVTDSIEYWIISVEEIGGCSIYSHFNNAANIIAPYNNPGQYTELWVCPTYGVYNLFFYLEGNPEPGGIWSPNLWMDELYYTAWGPGSYLYIHGHEHICPPDTASIRINFIDLSQSIIDISCSQNGTPTDIFDDQTVVTMTILGQEFGTGYTVTASTGTITPSSGVTGIPTEFTLSAGTAIGTGVTITVQGTDAPYCEFEFDIPAPGYCSDPCDYEMAITVSGDEDICLKNCPENPASMFVEVSGGTGPYTIDFELTSPNQPTVTYTGIEINAFEEIRICMDTIPAPVYNPGTGFLTLPASLGGSDVTFSVLALYDTYNCVGILDEPDHFITIHSLPVIMTTTLSLCRDLAINVDLTEYDGLISPFYDVTWFDGDPFGGGEEIANPTGANLENVVQLWAHIADDYCENAIQVPFMILPQPDLDSIPPIRICQGDNIVLSSIPIVDAGMSMATYTFHAGLPPDSTNILDTLVYVPSDSTIVYVLASTGTCFDTLPIEIFVEDIPDFVLEAQPCDLLLGTYSVLFTSSAATIIASSGTVVNNPSGHDAVTGIPNNTNITIEILNQSGLCRDTFQVIAPNCNCPVINQPLAASPSYAICDDEALPQMSVSVDPGLVANWYTVPSGGISFLQNSLTFQPTIPANAIYYVEAFDPSTSCYSIRTPISLQVQPGAILQHPDDPVICDGGTINLDALAPAVLNGVAGSGGWFEIPSNQAASGTIQPQDGETWQYVFTTTIGGCVSRDTLSAIVHPLPVIDVHEILCDDVLLTYLLAFTSDADVVIASVGDLSQVIGTDSFTLENIPFDTDVIIDMQFTATGCSSSLALPAPDCSCPALLQANALQVCSDPGQVDLSAFEGPGVNGTWQMVSTPPGVNPARLTGSDFDGFQADPGLYTLRFIRSVILANCVDSALFQLTLNASPFADAGADATVCAPDVITLSGTAGGSNVNFGWQTTGSGSIVNPASLNTSYTPTLSDITAGSVSFTLAATDQTGFCPDAGETITITIDGSAYYILNAGTQTYCDTADILVDLDALITFGNTGGEWFFPDTVNAPIVGSSQINPSTLDAGTYTIFYATSGAVAPCEDDTTAVNLLIENCACPSVAISAPAQGLCNQSETLNLNSLLITSEPGSWTIVNTPPGAQPATISGTQFVTANSDDGTYRLRFTLNTPVQGCPAFSEVDVEVIATPMISVTSVGCAGDLQSWEAVVSSTDPLVSNTGIVISLGNNLYNIENIPLNTPIQVSASSGNGLCTTMLNIASADCACTLSITNLPGNVSLCPDESIVLEPQVLDPKGDVTSFWIIDNDSLYQTTLNVTQAGTYQYVALDELGCREEYIVDVTYYAEMIPGVSWVDINCPGDENGAIVLQGIMGGTAPFFISVNGGAMQEVTVFPYILDGLGAGDYAVELLDGAGCSTSFNVEIQSASSETLSLGPDQTILAGDTVFINPLLSFTPDSFSWTGDVNDLLDRGQLNQSFQPETDQLFQLSAIDEKGCLYTDELRVRVLLNSAIYVPNVFSPNGDGINDIVAPLTDPSITMIQYFEIYSRWGELVYSIKDIVPNQPGIGWDGTMANEKMQPGVFVYRVGAVNKRGREFEKYGDVTLMR
jgi:gliding motility-associated-like protein